MAARGVRRQLRRDPANGAAGTGSGAGGSKARRSGSGYAFAVGERVPDALRRIAAEQVDGALDSLGRVLDGSDPDGGIHDARKRFKKVRALLRLVRGELPDGVFDRENVEYRDCGRLLADVRASAVARQTVRALRRPGDDGAHAVADAEALDDLEARLAERHAHRLERALRPDGPVEEVVARLRDARERIAVWPAQRDDFGALAPGLLRSYERGRLRMREAEADPSAPRFHEWRKRAKDLWYHIRLLEAVDPTHFGSLVEALDGLCDRLGEANDLSDLLRLLRDESRLLENVEVVEALAGRALERRELLWRDALAFGERCYGERPGDLVARVRSLWDAWRKAG